MEDDRERGNAMHGYYDYQLLATRHEMIALIADAA